MDRKTAHPASCRRASDRRLFVLVALALAGAHGSHGATAAEARLIIAVPDALRPSLDGWLEHKRTTLSVEVASLETVLRESPGADDPERLKRFLFEARRRGPGKEKPPADLPEPYVLLVGDADVLPVRYMVLDRVTPAAHDLAFYPSDLYYADVAKPDGSFEDWNGQKDHHRVWYHEPRTVDPHTEDPGTPSPREDETVRPTSRSSSIAEVNANKVRP